MTTRDERATFWRGHRAARTYCPRHPDGVMVRAGTVARCAVCGDAVSLCLAVYASKECCREQRHAGACVSPSGSSWMPDVADYLPPEITYVGRIGSARKCGPKPDEGA